MKKKNIIYLFVTLLFGVYSESYAKEYIVESTGKDTLSESITTSKGDTKLIRKIEGTWTDNLGDYGVNTCVGTIDSNSSKVFLDLLCESINQNKEKSWTIIYRKNTMGLGDFQLITILGAWVGQINIVFVLFLSSFLALMAFTIISLLKGYNRSRKLPFVPYLSMASIIIYLINLLI